MDVAEVTIEDIATNYGQGGMMDGGWLPGMHGEMNGERPEMLDGERPEMPGDVMRGRFNFRSEAENNS